MPLTSELQHFLDDVSIPDQESCCHSREIAIRDNISLKNELLGATIQPNQQILLIGIFQRCKVMLRKCKVGVVAFNGAFGYNGITKAKEVSL